MEIQSASKFVPSKLNLSTFNSSKLIPSAEWKWIFMLLVVAVAIAGISVEGVEAVRQGNAPPGYVVSPLAALGALLWGIVGRLILGSIG